MPSDRDDSVQASIWSPALGRLCVLERFRGDLEAPINFELLYRREKDPHGYLVIAEAVLRDGASKQYAVFGIGYPKYKADLRRERSLPAGLVRWRYATDHDLALIVKGWPEELGAFSAWLDRGVAIENALEPEERMRLSMLADQGDRSLWEYGYRALTEVPEESQEVPSMVGGLVLYVRDYGPERGLSAQLCTVARAEDGRMVLRSWWMVLFGRAEGTPIIEPEEPRRDHYSFLYGQKRVVDSNGERQIVRFATDRDLHLLCRSWRYHPMQRVGLANDVDPSYPSLAVEKTDLPAQEELARLARVAELYFPAAVGHTNFLEPSQNPQDGGSI